MRNSECRGSATGASPLVLVRRRSKHSVSNSERYMSRGSSLPLPNISQQKYLLTNPKLRHSLLLAALLLMISTSNTANISPKHKGGKRLDQQLRERWQFQPTFLSARTASDSNLLLHCIPGASRSWLHGAVCVYCYIMAGIGGSFQRIF